MITRGQDLNIQKLITSHCTNACLKKSASWNFIYTAVPVWQGFEGAAMFECGCEKQQDFLWESIVIMDDILNLCKSQFGTSNKAILITSPPLTPFVRCLSFSSPNDAPYEQS